MRAFRIESLRLRGWCVGAAVISALIVVSFVNNASAEEFDFDRRFPNNEVIEDEIRGHGRGVPDPGSFWTGSLTHFRNGASI